MIIRQQKGGEWVLWEIESAYWPYAPPKGIKKSINNNIMHTRTHNAVLIKQNNFTGKR